MNMRRCVRAIVQARDDRRPFLSARLASVADAAAGCGDDTCSSGFATMGMPGIPSPTRVGANLVFADVAVDGHPGGRLGVDTGAPVMLVDASKFPGLACSRPRSR